MQRQRTDYQVVPYPKYRRWMVAAFGLTRHKPNIHGLFEVDVTRARVLLRAYKAKHGESLSFTALLIACLAKAVDEHRLMQAYRLGGKRLIVFNDVDVLTDMERDIAGRKYDLPYVVRAANLKTVHDIHREIRAAQRRDASASLARFRALSVPAVLFRPFMWSWGFMARRRPRLWKDIAGTVEISSVGMFGTGPGWGISPPSATPLMLTVGGIGEKQITVDGHTIIREYLSLTISVNHEIVDGATTARFAQRLKDLIESAYGLDDETIAAVQESSDAAFASTQHVPAPHA